MISEVTILNNGTVMNTAGINEKDFLNGKAWRIGTGIVSLTTAQYASISFVTPADKMSYYVLSTIDKTGDELDITLVEGGTWSGATTASLWNVNRIVGDATPPFVAHTAGTITGGTEAPHRLIPGTAVGATKAGGSSESPSNITLKPNTRYTLKITSVSAAKLSALIYIVVK